MVVTKHLTIKHSWKLKKSLNYIVDESKTVEVLGQGDTASVSFQILQEEARNNRLVSAHLISDPMAAYDEMVMMKLLAEDTLGVLSERSDLKTGKGVLAHHIIQSFSPDDALTAEEIHEIGRRTVLELTGGDHSFVIATHVDRDHIHNHIIFNNTSDVTLKKFRWQKGTRKSLAHISDKHADMAGAKIIDWTQASLTNSHKQYAAWRRKNNYRYAIKERLDFLLKHATSLDDFKQKAVALGLAVDFSGKFVKYRLMDSDQVRNTRDDTLSKKGKYSLAAIQERVSQNQEGLSLADVVAAFEAEQAEKDQDFELCFEIEPWQIAAVTQTGLYLNMVFGVNNQGTIKIDAKKVDQLDNGNYQVFLKANDFFYFTNAKHADKNRYMPARAVAEQLSRANGDLVVRKNKHVTRLDVLVRELEFLAQHDVRDGQAFEDLQDRFDKEIEATETELDRLDDRLALLNKIGSALKAIHQEDQLREDLAKELLAEAGISPKTSLADVKKLVQEIQIERTDLRTQLDQVLENVKAYHRLKLHLEDREVERRGLGR